MRERAEKHACGTVFYLHLPLRPWSTRSSRCFKYVRVSVRVFRVPRGDRLLAAAASCARLCGRAGSQWHGRKCSCQEMGIWECLQQKRAPVVTPLRTLIIAVRMVGCDPCFSVCPFFWLDLSMRTNDCRRAMTRRREGAKERRERRSHSEARFDFICAEIQCASQRKEAEEVLHAFEYRHVLLTQRYRIL